MKRILFMLLPLTACASAPDVSKATPVAPPPGSIDLSKCSIAANNNLKVERKTEGAFQLVNIMYICPWDGKVAEQPKKAEVKK